LARPHKYHPPSSHVRRCSPHRTPYLARARCRALLQLRCKQGLLANGSQESWKKAKGTPCPKIRHMLYICPIFRRKASMATLVKDPKSLTFPEAAVEACIRDALSDQAADQVVLRPTA